MSVTKKVLLAVAVFALLPQIVAFSMRYLPDNAADAAVGQFAVVLVALPIIGFGLAVWKFRAWNRGFAARIKARAEARS